MYIRYQRNTCPAKKLKASAKALRVLEKIAHGYSYREIAMMLDVSKSCIEKHINKLLFDNQCNHANELVTMFADLSVQLYWTQL